MSILLYNKLLCFIAETTDNKAMLLLGDGFSIVCIVSEFLFFACRNGRFLLRSSQNIIMPSVLMDCEEALNQGSITAAEVFISTRSKSILHLFASIGRFLGLEVNFT